MPSSPSIRHRADLLALQRQMAAAVMRPLTSRWRMQRTGDAVAETLIKPNGRLNSFARLEIYNRQYWFRLLDCLYDDFPGLLAIVGPRRFLKLATAYLTRHPSNTFALRDLGAQLENFLIAEPRWTGPRHALALDMVRFEWAQIVAFDAATLPPLTPDDILDLQSGNFPITLQPCITLLELSYPVDEFLIALKGAEFALRAQASNARSASPDSAAQKKRPPFPRRRRTHLAVHRQDNRIFFKRLTPEACLLLTSLRSGASLDQACARAMAASPLPPHRWPPIIREWFSSWSAMGWLSRRRPASREFRP